MSVTKGRAFRVEESWCFIEGEQPAQSRGREMGFRLGKAPPQLGSVLPPLSHTAALSVSLEVTSSSPSAWAPPRQVPSSASNHLTPTVALTCSPRFRGVRSAGTHKMLWPTHLLFEVGVSSDSNKKTVFMLHPQPKK